MRARVLSVLIAATLVACGSQAASFDPGGPCEADGRAPGAYPDLEALLPRELLEMEAVVVDRLAVTAVDSGRSCTERGLSTFASHGVSEIRFAGATWDLGEGDGIVSAVFTTPSGQPALEHAWVEEFYEVGARASTKTENIKVTHPEYAVAGPAYRLDTLNDLSLQSVVVWPEGENVRVVIVATTVEPQASRSAHEERLGMAVTQSPQGEG